MRAGTRDLYEAFAAGFGISGEGWNGEILKDGGRSIKNEIRKQFNAWKNSRKEGPPLKPASQVLPWEALQQAHGIRQWEALNVEEQRDELLAAVGLLVEWGTDVMRDPGPRQRWILMTSVIQTMGRRYGPWSR